MAVPTSDWTGGTQWGVAASGHSEVLSEQRRFCFIVPVTVSSNTCGGVTLAVGTHMVEANDVLQTYNAKKLYAIKPLAVPGLG